MTASAFWRWVFAAAVVLLAAFQMYTAATVPLRAFLQGSIHLGLSLVLTFLGFGWRGEPLKTGPRWDGLLLAALAVLVNGRLMLTGGDIPPEVTWRLSPSDAVLAAAMLLVVLEGARRRVGLALPVTCLVFVVYGLLGRYLPGPVGHPGITVERLLSTVYLTDQGIFGVALDVSATQIFMLVFYGGFVISTGAGAFLLGVSEAIFGRYRGGAGKMAVATSAAFGTMTGSGIANAAAIGTFTVPTMIRSGFSRDFAAGVECAASMGSQIMPPVLGVAVFLMAQILGVPYSQIAWAALPAAVFYFASVFIGVDLYAARHGLVGKPRAALPSMVATLRSGWRFVASPAVLFYFLMIEGTGPAFASLLAFVAAVVLEVVHRQVQGERTFAWLRTAVADGAATAVGIAVATAAMGIIIGITDLTGLALKMSSMLLDMSGGNLFALLLLTMVASLLLGTGLPTVLTYIILAVLVAPALVQAGVEPLAAHLFIFYFGIIADLTPPVAVSAVITAGIAGGTPLRTSLWACRLAFPGFVIPFVFVLRPGLLLKGSVIDIALDVALTGASIFLMSIAIEGFLRARVGWLSRAAFAAAALGLLWPEMVVGMASLAVAGIFAVKHLRSLGHARNPVSV